MSDEESPKISPGDKIVTCCPLCSIRYDEPVPTNIKITCPDDAGCGKTFLVKSFEK